MNFDVERTWLETTYYRVLANTMRALRDGGVGTGDDYSFCYQLEPVWRGNLARRLAPLRRLRGALLHDLSGLPEYDSGVGKGKRLSSL